MLADELIARKNIGWQVRNPGTVLSFFLVLCNCLRDYQGMGSVRSFHVQQQRTESVPGDAEGSRRTKVLPWKAPCVTTRLRM